MPGGTRNGGVIGVSNKTSFGKNRVTATTATGNFTTQPGTTLLNATVVAGGGGGGTVGVGNIGGGGGGAGGVVQNTCLTVCGATAYPVVIGGGGATD